MVRPPLTPGERMRGERLGMLLREARGHRSMAEVMAEEERVAAERGATILKKAHQRKETDDAPRNPDL